MSNSWPDCEGFKDEGSVFDGRDSEIFTAETASTSLDLEHWLKRNSGGFYLFIPDYGRCRVSAIKTKVYGNFIIRFFYLGEEQSRQVVVMWGDHERPAGGRLYTLPPDAVTITGCDFFVWSPCSGGPAFVEVDRKLRSYISLILHKEKSVCIAGDFGLTKTIDKKTGDIYWLVGDKQKNYHEILFREGPKVSEPLKCELKETPAATGEIDPILQSANALSDNIVISPTLIVIHDGCKFFVKNPEDNEDHKEHWLGSNQGGFLLTSQPSLGVVTSISTSKKGGTYIRVFGFSFSRAVVLWGSYGTVWGGRKLTIPVDAAILNADDFHYSRTGENFVFNNQSYPLAPAELKITHTSRIDNIMVLSKAENEKTKEIYWLIGTAPAVAPNFHMVVCIEKPKKEGATVEPPKTKADMTENRPTLQTIMGEENTPMGYIPPPGVQDSLKLMSLQKELEWIEKLKQPQDTIQKTLDDLAKEVAGLRKLQVEHFNELSESIGEMYERNFSQELAEFSELMDGIPDMQDLAKVSPPFQMRDMHRLVTNTLIGMVRDAKEMSIQSFIEEFLKGAALRLKD